ncbi:surface glycan-binding family protein [Pedobacter arcticus]|uniref:surface glycan-binding family protein n=1 Tax=Pedobacter arcticus TaxID=752140 RepID=UPI00031ADEEB|nr:surface glycan-binding family protein [Pedobacter arcticus]
MLKLINTKPNVKRYISWAFALLFIVAACKKEEVIDNGPFTIYYNGMTDIGPSMSGIISSPSYNGGNPSAFEITGITLDGVAYTGTSFEVNPDNGSISIKDTKDLSIGLYKLTISCMSGGKMYQFKDAVEVNMMRPVPEGITVEPNKLTVNYADVIDAASTVELPTAQVTTNGDHVSIRKYEIAKTDYSKYFAVSSTGLISIVRGDATLLPGKYVLSLKLTTGASAGDEGIFQNAIEINVISKPLALTYAPATGKIEEESVQSGKTSYTSTVPALKGSLDNVAYAITNVTPTTDKIKIDAKTGVITVAENHSFTAGQQYKVNVNVKNEYDQAGVVFTNAFTLDVVEFIEPIQQFTYANKNAIQAVAFDLSPAAGFKGDEVRFEFVDLPAALQGKITLNAQGKISAVKGNSIALGTYTVKVKATNPKNESTASFALTIAENPNYFTYVRYGNNLGLAPAQNYANQFRVASGAALSTVQPSPTTDAKVSVTYEIRNVHQGSGTTIDAATGEIIPKGISAAQIGVFMVTATAGKGTPEEFSVQTPIFIHNSQPVKSATSTEMVTVEYSPFVYQANPTKGGRSTVPVIAGVTDKSKFTLDYRRTFNYYNFFGPHLDGQPSVANSFLRGLWDNYAAGRGISPNYGSRDPLSYYGNVNSVTQAMAYVDAATFEVVVNPNKWIVDGEPANGVMSGQITFGTDGKDPQSGGQLFPIILWFDSKF